jgi:hypothetical protein
MSMKAWPAKDPDEVLDYGFNWNDTATKPVLEAGETLVTSTFAVIEGDVVIDSSSFVSTGRTTVWLSAGTAATPCVIRNRVTTSGGRTYDQSAKLRIREK